MTITFTIPLRTRNHSNEREHWATRARRSSRERTLVAAYWTFEARNRRLGDGETACVTLTRIAPRKLDEHDGLRSALKSVADEIATCLGFDKRDNDPRLTWSYAQERGKPNEYAVRVSIEITSPAQDFEAMTKELTFPGTGGAK